MEEYLMGAIWDSFYIYYSGDCDKLLVKYIYPLLVGLNSEKETRIKFFFIRYQDELGTHIRLRIANHESDFYANICTYFFAQKEQLKRDHLEVSEIINRKYVPEIDRYGGIQAINIAEEIFCLSSHVILDFLTVNNNPSFSDKIRFSLSMQYILLMQSCDSNNDLLSISQFLLELWENEYLGPDYSSIGEQCKNIWEENKIPLQNMYHVLSTSYHSGQISLDNGSLNDWYNKLLILINSIKNLHADNKLMIDTTSQVGIFISDSKLILGSYIHMNNNRLGINNIDEILLSFLFYMLTLGEKQNG